MTARKERPQVLFAKDGELERRAQAYREACEAAQAVAWARAPALVVDQLELELGKVYGGQELAHRIRWEVVHGAPPEDGEGLGPGAAEGTASAAPENEG